ncbi:hypothetical protein ACN27J_16760 [Solwaraspora sp. WMMB762]|uniref:hypothetical protein n=1 Tax=Solwaraspora sp. WMMB762 TaxID=3404120 RepID=UPI003B955387
MSSSISRDSFREPKNYLGVHFQQGRPILDADLNEAQTVLRSMVNRGVHHMAGDGSPNHGFAIEQIRPPLRLPNPLDDPRRIRRSPDDYTSEVLDYAMQYAFRRTGFFLTVPGDPLEEFTPAEFTASQGRARVSHDRPYQGDGCLRVSGHTGSVTVSQKLDSDLDLSAYDVATFRYRLNRPVAGIIRFFLRDDKNNRTSWPCQTPLSFPTDTWLAGAVDLADGRFHILDEPLPALRVGQSFTTWIVANSGPTEFTTLPTWKLSGKDLPPWIHILTAEKGSGRTSRALIVFQPKDVGTFSFDLTAVDGENRAATRSLSITVLDEHWDGGFPSHGAYHDTSQYWSNPAVVNQSPQGTTTDLTAIREYGFELYQADEPLVWDLDDLRLGGADLLAERGKNDFVIRGSDIAKHVRRASLFSTLRDEDGSYHRPSQSLAAPFDALSLGDPHKLQAELDSVLVAAAGAADGPGRFYLAGLPCVQAEDILYSDQADPNDEPLAPPKEGHTRRDEVYLDAWTEPVTYVQDPAIREVALGGPDTSAREQVRHRVRVAQGGRTPTGDGMGSGTLATEGTYTAAANRLYRVEIDLDGDIGTATFRWSHENASVIARVIDDVAADSTGVVVEDASAFHPGDLVLLRTEFRAERHEVSQVSGNEITLAASVGDEFSVTDRPMVQRWDGFGVTIAADPDDGMVSASIPLHDGIRIRFGGHSMRAGDFWTFTTRYLADDARTRTDATTRIERLAFARPQGVRHHYAPLATFIRHGVLPDRDHITDIEDLRPTLGGTTRAADLPQTSTTGTQRVHFGDVRLPASSRRNKYLIILSGWLSGGGGGSVTIDAVGYTDEMTDPETNPEIGRVLTWSESFTNGAARTPVFMTIFTHTRFDSGSPYGTHASVGPQRLPTSVQFFAKWSQSASAGETRTLKARATVIELH